MPPDELDDESIELVVPAEAAGERLDTFVADRVPQLTRAQVKERRPLVGWERRYSRPEWTTDMFIDAMDAEFRPGSTR